MHDMAASTLHDIYAGRPYPQENMQDLRNRRWRTPHALKTPKHVVTNNRDSSFMSVEEDGEENLIRITIAETVADRDAPVEKKRVLVPSSAPRDDRKRMRICLSASVRKRAPKRDAFDEKNVPPVPDFSNEGSQQTAIDKNALSLRLNEIVGTYSRLSLHDLHLVTQEIDGILPNLDHSERLTVDQLKAKILDRIRCLQAAEQLRAQGSELYREQQYFEAESIYSQAILLDASSAVLYHNRAAARLMQGRHYEAVSDCERALALDATMWRAALRAAKAHLELGDLTSIYQYLLRTEKAIDLIRIPGQSDDISRNIMEVENAAKEFERAMLDAEKMLSQDDFGPAAHRAREALFVARSCSKAKLFVIVAECMAASRDTPSLTSELVRKAIQRLDTEIGAIATSELLHITLVLFGRSLVSEAVAFIELALAWSPQNSEVSRAHSMIRDVDSLLRRAKRLQDDGRFEDSTRLCTEALVFTGRFEYLTAKILVLRANSYLASGKMLDAEADIKKVIQKAPKYFAARIVLARVFVAMNYLEKAENELQYVETHYLAVLKTSHKEEIKRVRNDIATRKAKEFRKHSEHFSESKRQRFGDENENIFSPQKMSKMNHYAILGVDRRASQEEIRKAYRKMALRYHPDKNSDPKAADIFKRINEAAHVISSPTKRRMYDITNF